MKEKVSHPKQKYSLLTPAKTAPDLIITCPGCGGEVELWSEEPETICLFCNRRIFERELTVH